MPLRVLDARAAQAGPHAVTLRRHLVRRLEERADAPLGEAIVLRSQDHAHGGGLRVVGDQAVAHLRGGASRGRPQGSTSLFRRALP